MFRISPVPGIAGYMHRILMIFVFFLALLSVASTADAAPSEKRLALVIGNALYPAKTLATPVNDAALIAQTLRTAGFDVVGARDLKGDSLRQAFHDFVDRVTKAGPDTVAAVYFAGYGLQFEGENYLVPIDADIGSTADVALRALRLSDQTHALGAMHLKATLLILDAARVSPFRLSGRSLAGGLAWVEPESNMLIAFNATPGTVAPNDGESYGPYAKALAEMIREGDLTPANVFDRVRLRVHELTRGAQVPWDASKIETQFIFLERGPAAPPRADAPARTAWMRSQAMRSLGADDAYMVALLRDTFDGYADFLADYWNTPMAKRVWALLAARREAITWRRTYQANVSEAYWSYLKRYPHGPHTADAGRLLAHLGAATQPPAKFAVMDYEVPSPLPDELKYIERPALVFDDPEFAFEPPPPSPAHFLTPPPPEILALKAPAAPDGPDGLPRPLIVPLPDYVSVPASSNLIAYNHSDKAPPISNADKLANKLDGQTASSWPILPADKELAASPPPPRSVAALATPSNGQSPAPEVTPEEIKGPPNRPLPAISATPAAPTDDQSPAIARVTMSAPTTDNKPSSIPTPALPAPLSTGSVLLRTPAILPPQASGSMPLGQPLPAMSMSSMPGLPTDAQALATARITALPPTTDSKPTPVPGPEMFAPPATGSIPLLSPAIVSPQSTGGIPLPIPRPVTLVQPATDGIPLPTPRPRAIASQAQPIPSAGAPPVAAVDQAAQPSNSASAPAIARAPKAAAGVLPPPVQLCPIVNGRRICN
jgi:uncharacterized caspase-like protein